MYVLKLQLSANRLSLGAHSPKDFINYFVPFMVYAANTNISSADLH